MTWDLVNVGDEYVRTGRLWVATGIEPYTRKDGSQTELAVWKGHCKRCGGSFELKTPAAFALDKSSSFEVAHCQECRKQRR